MKNFFTLTLCFLTLSLTAQVEYPFPYNPDVNSDGYIGINDLMELLSMYGEEFGSDQLFYSDTEAVLDLGAMYYGECVFQCSQLQGDWKVADIEGIGKFRDDLQNDLYWNDLEPSGGELGWTRTADLFTGFTQTDNTLSYDCACLTRAFPEIDYQCIVGNWGSFVEQSQSLISQGYFPAGGSSNLSSNFRQCFWKYVE